MPVSARSTQHSARKEAKRPLSRLTPHVLDLLSQLAKRSLILAEETPGGMRYRMIETVREFAIGRLDESDPDAWRSRHAEWCLRQAQREPRADITVWLDKLEAERENMRAAIEWCAQREPLSG